MGKTSSPPRESAIQRVILDWLLLNGFFAWRNNVSPIPIRRGREIVGIRKADPHTVGMPDILCVIPCPCCRVGIVVGIEVKREGGKQSEAQKEWQRRMEKAGGIYILATDVDAVEWFFKERRFL